MVVIIHPNIVFNLKSQSEYNTSKIDKIMSYLKDHGGYCDCEILMNVELTDELEEILNV